MTPEIKPFKIRDVEINPPLVLSPMAGVTDVSFRRLLKRRGGVGLSVSEFISVEGLTRNNPKSKRQMRFYEDERPFAVQIFGGQVERMCMAAEMAQEVGADILDVNCGCPAPKVVKHGGGSGLLKDHSRLADILKAIKKVITIPLTVKIRAGFLRPHDQRRGHCEARGRLRRRAHRSARSHERAGLSWTC
jgi:tRNA-dihydrouridine synthase B